MKELIKLLNPKERKVLQLVFLASCLGLLFLAFVLSWEKGKLRSLGEEVAGRRKTLEQDQESLEKSKQLWLQWSATRRHLDEVKSNWYYRGEEGVQAMRLDLGQVMSRVGLPLPPVQYSYQEIEKDLIGKVSFNFRLATSYFSLRNFMVEIESFPKFLCLERLEFQNVSDEGNRLDVRLVVAGYHVK